MKGKISTNFIDTKEKYIFLANSINFINNHIDIKTKIEIINYFLEIGNKIFDADYSVVFLHDRRSDYKEIIRVGDMPDNEYITDDYFNLLYDEVRNNIEIKVKNIRLNNYESNKYSIMLLPLEKIETNEKSLYGFILIFSKNKIYGKQSKKLGIIYSKHFDSFIKLNKYIYQIKLLHSVNRSLTEAQELRDTLQLILKYVSEIFKCKYVHILKLISVNRSNDYLEISASTDSDIKIGDKFKKKEGFSGWIVKNNAFILICNLQNQVKSYQGITENEEIVYVIPKSLKKNENDKCILGVPLRYKGNPTGVILIANTINEYAYNSNHDKDLLQMFADQAAVAIENIYIHHQKEIRHQQILEQATLTNPSAIAMSFVHDARHSMSDINAYISGLLDFIPKEAENDPGFAQLKMTLSKESEKLISLFKSLVRYARKDELYIKRHKIKDIIDFINYLMTIRLKNISIDISYKPTEIKDVEIDCDRAEIEQLFINLYNNAIFALQQKKIKKSFINILVTELDPDNIEIQFTDNGIGISSQKILYIFDLFYTTKKEGTGFGLPICRRIVQDHHKGKIDVKSKIGEYTTFFIVLPKYMKEKEN